MIMKSCLLGKSQECICKGCNPSEAMQVTLVLSSIQEPCFIVFFFNASDVYTADSTSISSHHHFLALCRWLYKFSNSSLNSFWWSSMSSSTSPSMSPNPSLSTCLAWIIFLTFPSIPRKLWKHPLHRSSQNRFASFAFSGWAIWWMWLTEKQWMIFRTAVYTEKRSISNVTKYLENICSLDIPNDVLVKGMNPWGSARRYKIHPLHFYFHSTDPEWPRAFFNMNMNLKSNSS